MRILPARDRKIFAEDWLRRVWTRRVARTVVLRAALGLP